MSHNTASPQSVVARKTPVPCLFCLLCKLLQKVSVQVQAVSVQLQAVSVQV